MARSFAIAMGASSFVVLSLGAAGCVGLLGDFAVADDALVGSDAGDAARGEDALATALDAGAHDAPPVDARTPACNVDADCAGFVVPETVPAGCATFVCEAHACALVAKDEDGDGHRRAVCATKSGAAAIATGDDCDDTDAQRYPGNWDGPSVSGDPSRPNRCADKIDHNCNGVPGDDVVTVGGVTTTCPCAPNVRRACSPGPQSCPGSQTCGTDGKWGACATTSTPFEDPWTAPLGSSGGGAWSSAFGDPVVDVANHRLRLSSDDVVSREALLSGSYYVSHDLTLSGGTVFTPSAYLNEPFLPSIRRAGDDMQLGGDGYGGSWSDTQPAGFAGKRITGALTARVTTYMKAQSKQLAVKVEAGGVVYRSGWTPPFSWAQTNVSNFRLVGENNGAVYSGPDDYVYVGPLQGCSGLDDAAVEAAYGP